MATACSGGGYLHSGLPSIFLFEMGNVLLCSAASECAQLETTNKEHRCGHSCERAPIQEAITWAGIPSKETPEEAIKSGVSRRKNEGDNYLRFPTVQERGNITVWQ